RRCVRGRWETVNEPDTKWYGCGRRAAQNVLRYFGIEIAQTEIAASIPATPMMVNDQIAVYPRHLAGGLQHLLDTFAKARFTVTRHDHLSADDAKAYLRKG